MAIRTRITELLGIEHPIVQGGMQGVGTAAGSVIALAIVRDLFTGRAAATLLSRLFLVIGAAPVLAPTLGGELLRSLE